MGLFRATLVCIALCLLLIGWGGQGYAVEKAVPKEDKTPPKVEKAVETTYRTVTLRGLNKVTARSNEMESPVGTLTRFGNLEIIPMTCWKSSPEDQPENAAFM